MPWLAHWPREDDIDRVDLNPICSLQPQLAKLSPPQNGLDRQMAVCEKKWLLSQVTEFWSAVTQQCDGK